jgi:hypothetical protein
VHPIEDRAIKKMNYVFKRVSYRDLTARQQENFNFHKVAAHLANFGFNCMRLTDDWLGADFIALHNDGQTFFRVQLKTRLVIDKKYSGKGLYIAFIDRRDNEVYFYPHDQVRDELLAHGEEIGTLTNTVSWRDKGGYSWGRLSAQMKALMNPYSVRIIDEDW